ncbi:5'-nucleotidase C-terminal domain-containing protein [Brevibacterium sp. UMB10442]|uniref:bifunctional metallophosphatase/5'-nucleotidase n=1 Tax=Brevibacterium sp. UMB1308A TaxID=3050608 RepID=UPI00254A587A|nr:5'-nucleotidase C-terminal domain-containing protein [Brevibacterium sp. UMB1308A]MDK7749464.1 5'-nucleotidase C-terminal domain-containing protein [Brevibacterium sp. UMB10442]MDK8345555.1 5'-nucleotidase C-terminal domain-containing protein [Brevibacterium sp. UMB1308B]MDK8712600.1 5'-nucleotidase C-terminal domain-containing protein [Brevibacterium sp. UMB1308A]
MKRTTRAFAAVSALAVVSPLGALPAFGAADEGTEFQILNITDFHGRIGSGVGADLAGAVTDNRQENSTFLSAGDNIGASTYASSSQQDNPTLEYLDALGLDASAVGNHEFDRGFDDIKSRDTNFEHLGANVVKKGTDEPAFPAYTTYDVNGIKVAVIGVVTKDTKTLVSPSGIKAIDFIDPVKAVNKAAQELEASDEKPDITILEAHAGPSSAGSIEEATGSNDEFASLVEKADASIDAMFFGHSHIKMNLEAKIPGTDRTRPVVQAGNYGDSLADVRLTSEGNGDWTVKSSDLIEVEGVGTERDGRGKVTGYKDNVPADVKKIIDDAEAKAQEAGSVKAGEITEDITRAFKEDGSEDRGAESTLGNLVADALKEGVTYSNLEEADFGITNPGGLRTDLKMDDQFGEEAEGVVTDGELNQVLPFANDHGVVTMKGEDVIELFAQQWQPAEASRPFLHLGISKELSVVYDSSAEDPAKRVKSVKVNGEDIDPAKEYRVATLSFLANGGDNFGAFAKGTFEQSGLTDFEIWQKYFEENSPVSPDKKERQADFAKDILGSGDATAEVHTPDTRKNNFYLQIDSKVEAENLLFTVEAPKGYDVEWEDAKVIEGTENTVRVDKVKAGETQVKFRLVRNSDKTDGAKEFNTTLIADPAAKWWDNNPLPILRETKVGFVSEDKPGDDSDEGKPGDDSDEGKPGDDSDEATPGEGGQDDKGKDKGGSDKDGSDKGTDGSDKGKDTDAGDGKPLPRTGTETAGMIAAGIALLAVGAAAVGLTRVRRN